MNKCPFCGAAIDIETPFCPYCGNSKQQYQEHREDMQRYNQAFREVEQGVVSQNRKTSSNAAYITIIFALIALIGLVWFLMTQIYSISKIYYLKQAEKHKDEHIANIQQMIDEHDYQKLNEYFNDNLVYSAFSEGGPLEDYYSIEMAAGEYQSCENNLYYIVFADTMNDEQRINDAGYLASSYTSLCETYEKFSEEPDEYSYNSEKNYSDEHLAVIEDMKSIIDSEIQTYFRLTDEEMEQFMSGSENTRAYLLEQATNKLIEERQNVEGNDDEENSN